MTILLDACTPRPLRRFLSGHSVSTAQEMGWGGLKNGDLLAWHGEGLAARRAKIERGEAEFLTVPELKERLQKPTR